MVGKHAVFDVSNVGADIDLTHIESVKPLVHTLADLCHLHVVHEAGHQFEPHGVTYVLILSESHLSIHTYPEFRRAYVDIFCCDPNFDETHALHMVKRVLCSADVTWNVMMR